MEGWENFERRKEGALSPHSSLEVEAEGEEILFLNVNHIIHIYLGFEDPLRNYVMWQQVSVYS